MGRIVVGDQERVLLIRKGRFERILEPGEYWIWALGGAIETEIHNLKEIVFESSWADYLAKERPAVAERHFSIVETSDSQVAVVCLDGKLSRVIGPGKRVLFWRGPVAVTAEVIDVKDRPEVPQSLLAPLAPLARLGREAPVTYVAVEDGKTGLLFLENRFARALGPGLTASGTLPSRRAWRWSICAGRRSRSRVRRS